MDNKNYQKVRRISDYTFAPTRRDYRSASGPAASRPVIRARQPVSPGSDAVISPVAQTRQPQGLRQLLKDHSGLVKNLRLRAAALLAVSVIIISQIAGILPLLAGHKTYALGQAASLLSPTSQPMADMLKYDPGQRAFEFNSGYVASSQDISHAIGSLASASAYQDPSKGITVTDPVHKVSFSMVPSYNLWQGQQDGNRVIYPFTDGNGWLVETMHAIGVKEDVILNKASGDKLSLDYKLKLGQAMEARTESDGSIAIYGNDLFSSNISTGSQKDAALLQKARQNAPKNTLLFRLPAPVIKEQGKAVSAVRASYSLKGDKLQVNVTGLKAASYPLSIDPSIYVTSAQQFMNGNNETNIDFDIADKLIENGNINGLADPAITRTIGRRTAAILTA